MGFWATLIVWGTFYLISYLLREDPIKIEQEERDRASFNLPTAKEGTSVPLVWGRTRIRAPNVLWYGGFTFRSLGPITNDSDNLIYLFSYRWSVQMALGLPMMVGLQPDPLGARLLTIWMADRVLWSGEVFDTTIDILEPEFLGGLGKGGGYYGEVKFHQGTFAQNPDTYLYQFYTDDDDLDETLLPAYRGLMYIVFRDFTVGESPTMQAPSFEVQTMTDPLGLGDPAGTGDANPAEVVYDILVNPWGRLGLPTSRIDSASFIAAGTTLDTENHGFSLVQYAGVDSQDIIAEVLKEIDGILYEDVSTYKIVLKLIRADYILGDLDVYDESNLDRVEDYSMMTWGETFNQVRVDYTQRGAYYATKSVFAQDMANIAMQGGRKRSTVLHYPGINEKYMANAVVARELKALSLPLAKIRLVANRDAVELRPGDVFKFSWSAYGISEMVLRVTRFDLGSLDQNQVKIDCVEDRFATDVPIFGEPDVPDTAIIPSPDPVDNQDTIELPRWMAIRAFQLDLVANDEACRLFYLADKPSASTGLFDGYYSEDEGDNYDSDRLNASFVDYAEVETEYSKLDEPYDTTTGLRVDTLSSDLTLETATATEIREEGKNLILVDDELMAFESFTDIGGGVYRLDNVWRGLLDTVPATHAVNASVYFVLSSEFRPMGPKVFDGDEALKVRLITHNAYRALPPDSAPVEDLQLDDRAVSPVRPQQFRMKELDQSGIGTNDPGIVDENAAQVLWNRRERDRVTINRGDDLDDAETGTVYDVDCKVERDANWTELDADVNSTSVISEFQTMGHGPAEIRPVADDGTYEAYQNPTIDFILARYRQLLLNPTFNGDNGTGALDHWDIDVGSPTVQSLNPLDADGYSVGPNGADWTISQKVWIDKFFPVGLQARLRFYAYGEDATDTTTVHLDALDSSDVQQGTVNTGPFTPTTTWTSHDLLLTLPATTAKLRVRVVTTDGVDPKSQLQQFDEFDLRVGDFTAQQLANPQFNAGTASWTVVSGTWAVSTPAFEGANAVRCTVTGSHELYQQVTLPVGYRDTGTAWLKGWLATIAGTHDTAELIMEARDGGGVLASVTTGTLSYTADSKWHDNDLYLDLPDGTDRIRIRILVTNPDSASMHIDDLQLVVFKNLHPDEHEDIVDFSEPTQQTWPTKRSEWTDLGADAPRAIWLLDESSGVTFYDSVNYRGENRYNLFSTGSPDLAETLAGFYDGTDLANKLGFETQDGVQEGVEFPELAQCSIDGANSFALLLAFRAHDPASSYQPLMGSMDGKGWSVRMNSSGAIRATVISDAPIIANLDLSDDHGAAVPHYVVFQYNAVAGEFRVWSDRQQVAAVSVPASGDMANLSKAIIGGAPTDNSLNAQFGYGVLWTGAAGKDLVPADTDAWWNHAQDPTGFINVYGPGDIVAGDVDSDSDGIVVGRFSPGQIALFYNASLATPSRGISTHKTQTNMVDPDPNSTSWVEEGSPSVTKRFGADAERFHRSVELDSDNVDAYRPPAITMGSGSVTVVWYAKGDSAHNARLILWDDTKTVSIIHDYAVTTSWQKFEHTFAWGGSTATFELWFHGSDDATSRVIELSTPVAAFALSYAPLIVHPRTGTLTVVDASMLQLNNVLPDEFNEEGEISVTGICAESDPGTANILDVHNGTNDNDRRMLGNTKFNTANFQHCDGGGTQRNHEMASAWTSEWILRGRWNIGRLLEDATYFSSGHYNALDNYNRVATFSVAGTALDEIDFDAAGALISEVKLTSRELVR